MLVNKVSSFNELTGTARLACIEGRAAALRLAGAVKEEFGIRVRIAAAPQEGSLAYWVIIDDLTTPTALLVRALEFAGGWLRCLAANAVAEHLQIVAKLSDAQLLPLMSLLSRAGVTTDEIERAVEKAQPPVPDVGQLTNSFPRLFDPVD